MISYIMDQDRESLFPNIGRLMVEQATWGWNLFLHQAADKHLLGTFDEMGEALAEVQLIKANKDKVYCVSGYSNGGFAEWIAEESGL